MRDWINTLPRASFRGFSFHIEKGNLQKAGRAIVTHRYVKSEEHATEDMGRLPREFRVQAYFASDAADAETAALLAVCSTSGPGLLVLPMFEPGMVRCTNCSPSMERTKLGYVAFDLDFIEAGSDGAAFPALALGDRIAASALDTLRRAPPADWSRRTHSGQRCSCSCSRMLELRRRTSASSMPAIAAVGPVTGSTSTGPGARCRSGPSSGSTGGTS